MWKTEYADDSKKKKNTKIKNFRNFPIELKFSHESGMVPFRKSFDFRKTTTVRKLRVSFHPLRTGGVFHPLHVGANFQVLNADAGAGRDDTPKPPLGVGVVGVSFPGLQWRCMRARLSAASLAELKAQYREHMSAGGRRLRYRHH